MGKIQKEYLIWMKRIFRMGLGVGADRPNFRNERMNRIVVYFFGAPRTISTRRLEARPSGVLLSAMGSLEPRLIISR